MASKQTTLKIPELLYEQVQAKSRAKGLSPHTTALVAMYVGLAALERQPEFFDAAVGRLTRMRAGK